MSTVTISASFVYSYTIEIIQSRIKTHPADVIERMTELNDAAFAAGGSYTPDFGMLFTFSAKEAAELVRLWKSSDRVPHPDPHIIFSSRQNK